MAFASLTIDLNARLANIEKDLGKSVHLAERSAQKMQAAFAGVGKAFAALGVLGAGGSFVGMLKGLVDEADSLNDLATRTGTSVRALASLQLAAKLADTDLQNLGAGLGKLSIYMANNADEAAALGITARDPVEAFIQLADVIGGVTDPSERNALAMKVMGKSYAELMPLLAQGGDALRDQAEQSSDYADRMTRLAEGAAKFNDTLDLLGQTGKTALLPLAEAFTDFAAAALDAAEGVEGFDKVLAGLGQAGVVGKGIALVWANVAYVFNAVGTEIGGIGAQLVALSQGDFKGAGIIGDAMKDDAKKAREELEKLEQRILNFKANTSKPAAGKPGGAAFDVESLISPGDAEKLQATLRKAFDIKPLDDFIAGFGDRAAKIKQEYAKLAIDIGQREGPATGTDTMIDIGEARSAAAGGDTLKAEALISRAKSGLGDLMSFEKSYYARQLQDVELAMNEAAQKTAEASRDNLRAVMESQAAELAKMEPIHVPLATEAIAEDLRNTIEIVRRELAANPLVIPVVAGGNGTISTSISDAALKLKGR